MASERKGLFVFGTDLSGINSHLFAALRDLGWDIRTADVGLPRIHSAAIAARSFSPDAGRWRKKYHGALDRWLKGPSGIGWRSRVASQQVARLARRNDILMQIGGIFFAPEQVSFTQPYVNFRDYTTRLALRNLPRVLGSRTQSEIQYLMELEASVCRHAAIVFTASENTRRSVVEDYGVDASKVVVVGEGLNFAELPAIPERREPSNTVLFVGKDFERKGGTVVLEAFERVRRDIPEAQLVIVGPDAPASCVEGVKWLGAIRDRELLRGYFGRCAVFVMPSFSEPFGLVFLEAMAHGLPCIGADRDAMPEIIEDGVSGFLVPAGDAAALGARMTQLLRDPELGRRMGERGRKRVEERYRWSHVAARMDSSLATLLMITERSTR